MRSLFAALATLAFIGAALAQEARPGSGRYAIEPSIDGFIRLDTTSGAVSHCSRREGVWHCDVIVDDTTGLSAQIEKLTAEVARLVGEVADASDARRGARGTGGRRQRAGRQGGRARRSGDGLCRAADAALLRARPRDEARHRRPELTVAGDGAPETFRLARGTPADIPFIMATERLARLRRSRRPLGRGAPSRGARRSALCLFRRGDGRRAGRFRHRPGLVVARAGRPHQADRGLPSRPRPWQSAASAHHGPPFQRDRDLAPFARPLSRQPAGTPGL